MANQNFLLLTQLTIFQRIPIQSFIYLSSLFYKKNLIKNFLFKGKSDPWPISQIQAKSNKSEALAHFANKKKVKPRRNDFSKLDEMAFALKAEPRQNYKSPTSLKSQITLLFLHLRHLQIAYHQPNIIFFIYKPQPPKQS
jgi:hypothetical protein